ncbi:acyltransferase family protein [Thalassomonas sp. M1454]|uniref:acyltransferase family protein n=1 Tax=Thalassomonas sp. M1454 TaxID=2594477 RepID=UPI00117FDB8B|nr:acyltransferase family protein [Thalassomonas sp. M1454]TRX58168.1 acyltransferase [Thalassomonas sp. M1454]
MTFRKDINGLRAIAVMAVVLFHFNANWLPGGFAGVDVFFVISGFLMTGIIFKGLASDNFSTWNFYKARARRIVPALAILCIVVMLWGWFFLDPTEYRRLAKHAASSIGFVSNFAYLREAGYFDVASHQKWLLHTWSLSAEWQFYILYPLILVLLKRFMSFNAMKLFVLVGTVVGFVFCAFATSRWPDSSYYLLHTRAWEMMLGGVAYLYPFKMNAFKSKLLEIVGLTLIIASCLLITNNDPWPGYLAFFPVFGAFLIIQAQCNDSIFTQNIIFQKIGAWSYSIYLWHWPLVVCIYYFSLSEVFIYLGLSLSILFGFLSYKFVETFNWKNDSSFWSNYFKYKPIYLVISVGLLCTVIIEGNGIDLRSSNPDYSYKTMKKALKANHGLSKTCERSFTLSEDCRTDQAPEVVVWGDSYAMHIVNGIVASNPNPKVIQFTKSQCAPFFNLTRAHTPKFIEECLTFTKQVKEWLQANETVKYVVLSARFMAYFELDVTFRGEERIFRAPDEVIMSEFQNTLVELEDMGFIPVIFSPPPQNSENIARCLDRQYFYDADLSVCDFEVARMPQVQQKVHTWLRSLSNNYKTIMLDDILCDGGICKTHFKDTFIYRDEGHLSAAGSELLGVKNNFYDLIIK